MSEKLSARRKIQGQLQLALSLPKRIPNKGLLQLAKTQARPLMPVSVKRTIAVTVSVRLTNLSSIPDQTISKRTENEITFTLRQQ